MLLHVHNYFVTGLLNFCAIYFFSSKISDKIRMTESSPHMGMLEALLRLEIVVWILILNHLYSLISFLLLLVFAHVSFPLLYNLVIFLHLPGTPRTAGACPCVLCSSQ